MHVITLVNIRKSGIFKDLPSPSSTSGSATKVINARNLLLIKQRMLAMQKSYSKQFKTLVAVHGRIFRKTEANWDSFW